MGWIALAAMLSSLSLVWGLTRLWRRRIQEGVASPRAPRPAADPIQAALNACRRPGAEALSLPLPPELRPEQIAWSAALPAPLPLVLCGLQGHDAAAVALFEPAPGGPGLEADLSGFGQQVELRHDGPLSSLWLYCDLHPTAFDLLCTAAAAAHLQRPVDPPPAPRGGPGVEPASGPISETRVPVIAWTTGGGVHGSLPPFGSLLIGPNSVRFSAVDRLALPGAGGGGADLLAHELELPLRGLRAALLAGGALRLSDGEVEVTARRLDGRSEHLAEVLGALKGGVE